MIIVCSSVSLLACDIFPLPFLRFQLISLKLQISHPSYRISSYRILPYYLPQQKESPKDSPRLAFEFRKYSTSSLNLRPSIHQSALLARDQETPPLNIIPSWCQARLRNTSIDKIHHLSVNRHLRIKLPS